jgi:hypothetical protein
MVSPSHLSFPVSLWLPRLCGVSTLLSVQVTSSPPLLVGAATLAVGLPAAGWVRDRLGGYNGALQPARALEVLQSENAILLDMR